MIGVQETLNISTRKNILIEITQPLERNEKKWTAEKKCPHFCQSGPTLPEIYFSSPEPQARSPDELKVYPCSGVGPSSVHSVQTSQKSYYRLRGRCRLSQARENM